MKKSLWQKYSKIIHDKTIDQNMETDILIIGAGITGITTCYNLIDTNFDIILIDKSNLYNNASAKNTGKITYLQDLMYEKIESVYDFETAKKYYESQKEAIRLIKKNIKKENIDCNLVSSNSITFTNYSKELKKFDREEQILKKLNVKYEIKDTINDIKVKRAIEVKDAYVFNPVKYQDALVKKIKGSKNIRIYQNSIATKISKEDDHYIVKVNEFEIKTKKIVLACGIPFFIFPGLIPFKTYLEKSYLTATKVDNIKKINMINTNLQSISLRYYEDDFKYLVYLTESSKICDRINYKENYNKAILNSEEITGQKPTYVWTNMDIMTIDHLPIVGKISEDNKNVYIGTCYNTWGMTNGTIAAKIISDLIMNKSNKYENLFKIDRGINIKKTKNFMLDVLFSNAKSYIFNSIVRNPKWYKNKVLVTNEGKNRIGIYYDSKGIPHKVLNTCPHMHCPLTFNEVDKTWDCPCHGSRFDIDGNIINGPSKYDIKFKNEE